MSIDTLKREILRNSFVDKVRGELVFDEEAYRDLTTHLAALAVELRGARTLDRELALVLYSIPLMVRNAFLSFAEHPVPRPPIADQLEDAWTELDSLVTDCLAD